jgi:alpha-ribazole phosphatase
MRLLLIRHGETLWNAEGRFQGQTDVALSLRGEQQAAALVRIIENEAVDVFYASDLQRAWQTALMLAEALGVPLRKETRLREMAFGRWEGLTYTELQQRDAALLAAWQADPSRTAPPGGETLLQITERVSAALKTILATVQAHSVAVVAHSGPLRVLLCLALGFDVRSYWRFVLAPASLSELQVSATGAVLTRLNDTHHLTELKYDV